jgi:DnaJ like chaperone protein
MGTTFSCRAVTVRAQVRIGFLRKFRLFNLIARSLKAFNIQAIESLCYDKQYSTNYPAPMNPLQFFYSKTWLGKLIGALFGYMAFGAVGAVLGIIIGNLFDQGLAEHLSKPYSQYRNEKRASVKNIFFEATFTVMGHIAKADGRVTEEQIRMVKQLMSDLQLSATQQKLAQHYFREGKKPDYNLWQILTLLRDATRDNPELLKLFIDLQFQMVVIGGISLKKQQMLNAILTYMGFAPLHQQHRFYEDFAQHQANQRSQSQGQQSSHKTNQSPPAEHAYRVLGVTRSTNKQDVKRAYRQLISRNHPDKLIAKGLPESMIKLANEKTQQIRKAYEQICMEKGW